MINPLAIATDGYLNCGQEQPLTIAVDGFLNSCGISPTPGRHAADIPEGGHKKKESLEKYGVENYDDIMAVINAFLLCQN